MATVDDMASDTEQYIRDVEIKARRREGPIADKTNKSCFGCFEDIAEGLRFHDAACRDEWQRRQGADFRNFEY